MRNQNLISAVFVVFFGLAQAAMAAGGGMSGGARSGGMSGDHMSPSGQTNNDAPFNPDATRGLDRAQKRMSDRGATHQQATAQEKKQGKTKAAARKAKQAKTIGTE